MNRVIVITQYKRQPLLGLPFFYAISKPTPVFCGDGKSEKYGIFSRVFESLNPGAES
jgi:hypothetical protein